MCSVCPTFSPNLYTGTCLYATTPFFILYRIFYNPTTLASLAMTHVYLPCSPRCTYSLEIMRHISGRPRTCPHYPTASRSDPAPYFPTCPLPHLLHKRGPLRPPQQQTNAHFDTTSLHPEPPPHLLHCLTESG